MPTLKKSVFSAALKLSKDGELRTEHGNRFHAAGPAMTNARPPNFDFVRWTTRSPWADDRVRPWTLELAQSSDKYEGASPCIALYIIRHSLNWMRCVTGSQCSRSTIDALFPTLCGAAWKVPPFVVRASWPMVTLQRKENEDIRKLSSVSDQFVTKFSEDWKRREYDEIFLTSSFICLSFHIQCACV